MRHKSLRLATLLSLMASSALVLVAISFSEPTVLGATLNDDALHLRSAHLLRRRAFNDRVLTECQARVEAGQDIQCPDINDPEAVRAFLEKVTPGDEETQDPLILTRDMLTDQQEALMRRLERVGTCPPMMNDIRDGFLDLCISIVGREGQHGAMQRIMERLPRFQEAGPRWTLEERIEQGNRTRPDR